MPSLETRDLTIRFGGHVAVNAVSCAYQAGTLTAIVGPNGAGKTTYFNLISGQLKPSAGSVLLDGRHHRPAGVRPLPCRPGPRLPADQPLPRPDGDGKRAAGAAVAEAAGAGPVACVERPQGAGGARR